MNNKLISVIMSTYNEPKDWVCEAIDSILNQEQVNIEFIIVCDNPKNKELIDLLNYYKDRSDKIKLIFNEKNMGLTKSLNKAIEASTGEYIARMDSDDYAEKDRLYIQLNYLMSNNLDLIGSAVNCVSEDKKLIRTINNLPKNHTNVIKKILYNNCLPHPTWFGKREVFIQLQGYRDINYAEDYDFLLRALFKGYKLGNINKALLNYRMRSSSISNQNGLKQFLTSQTIVQAYKDGIILNAELVNTKIKERISSLTQNEETEYMEASKLFMKGLETKNPFMVGKSIITSQYYRRKILCYIKGLL